MILRKYIVVLCLIFAGNLYSFDFGQTQKQLEKVIDSVSNSIRNIDKLLPTAQKYIYGLKAKMENTIKGFTSGNSSFNLKSIMDFFGSIFLQMKTVVKGLM